MAAVLKTAPPDSITPIRPETERARMLARLAEINKAKQAPEPVLRDIQQHIAPYRGRFQSETQGQRGQRKGLKVINNTAGRSMKILSSGLMAGLTSPGRPWFKLMTHDPDLSEFTPVRAWLDDVARVMRTSFAHSNLYNVLPSVYGELGPFGTTALLQIEDAQSIFRFYPFTIGSFAIAQDDRLVVDTFAREYTATVRQLAARFGTDNLSNSALNSWRQGKLEAEVTCVHMIQPNLEQNTRGFGYVKMPILEQYWEKSSDKPGPLMRSGYQERALYVPRWDVTGDDLWGTGIGHDILGDVKQLQFLERRKEDVLDKHTAPPLEAGVELRGKRLSLLSGDVTYTNPSLTGGATIRPIVETSPQAYQYAAEDIRELMTRIRSACYEDLFLMLANDTRSGITAREVEERHQEKMLVLGPVLERLNEELFDPMIDRTFAILQRQSKPIWEGKLAGVALLPPPPKDIQDQDLRVEYTSILAQAAKATSTTSLVAFGQFVGGMGQAKLAAQQAGLDDKVNWDQLIDEYADSQGIPSRVIVSDDVVAQSRDAKDKQAKLMQLAQMAPVAKDLAGAAKDAAGAVPQDGSVLSNIASAMPTGALGLPGT
jgi:hypothetical protein